MRLQSDSAGSQRNPEKSESVGRALANGGRRSFLKAILAAGVAPYVVTAAGVLMPVRAIAASEILVCGGNMTATEVLWRQREWIRQGVRRLQANEQFWIDPVYRRLVAAGAIKP